MSRLVKIVNNKYVQIEEYKNPNICFNTNEYDNFEDYCTLRETFDPFEIFYENQELKKQVEEYQQELEKADSITQSCIFNGKKESKISYRKCLNILDKKETQQKEFIEYLKHQVKLQEELNDIHLATGFEEILQKYKEITRGKDEKEN